MQESCLTKASKSFQTMVARELMHIYDVVSELQYFYPNFDKILPFKIMEKKISLTPLLTADHGFCFPSVESFLS